MPALDKKKYRELVATGRNPKGTYQQVNDSYDVSGLPTIDPAPAAPEVAPAPTARTDSELNYTTHAKIGHTANLLSKQSNL